MVVEHTPGDPGVGDDLLGAGAVIAVSGEMAARTSEAEVSWRRAPTSRPDGGDLRRPEKPGPFGWVSLKI